MVVGAFKYRDCAMVRRLRRLRIAVLRMSLKRVGARMVRKGYVSRRERTARRVCVRSGVMLINPAERLGMLAVMAVDDMYQVNWVNKVIRSFHKLLY